MDAHFTHFSQYILEIIPYIDNFNISFHDLIQYIRRTTLNFILYFHQLMMTLHYI